MMPVGFFDIHPQSLEEVIEASFSFPACGERVEPFTLWRNEGKRFIYFADGEGVIHLVADHSKSAELLKKAGYREVKKKTA